MVHTSNTRYFHIPYVATDFTAAYKAENTALDDAVSSDFMDERKVELFRMGGSIRVSLEADNNAPGLQTMFTQQIAKSIAKLENTWFISGTGSNQARGLLNRGTSNSAASASALTLDEILDIIYDLPDDYADGAVMLTKRANLSAIRAITGDPAYFSINDPNGGNAVGLGGVTTNEFIGGFPVYTTSAMGGITASAKSLAIFQPDEYHIVDHSLGLLVQRDPYTLMTAGAVNIVFQRWVGADLPQATACQYILHPTA
jgi:HK97 family phage major capsid protein